ncbi:MAG: hypothetical protein Tsb0021_18260 [Chlamydiales bacterium]
MELQSPAFEHHAEIPQKYTCDGEDVSPELLIASIPQGTVVFALIVDDPDAPNGTFDHWIAWNIPVSQGIREGQTFPNQGKNHFGDLGYRGPCPPPGKPHRYFFKLYALNQKIELPQGATKKQLEEKMRGHILEKAELVGIYQRK